MLKFKTIDWCCVCDGPVEEIINLPKLPLTGVYSNIGEIIDFPKLDQSLMLCSTCSHAQLKHIIDPTELYGYNYGFRTSSSETATRSVLYFYDFISRTLPENRLSRVLEFGCNDAVLLKLLAKRSDRLLGVDPILKGREREFEQDGISVIGALVEDVDICEKLGGRPDLIVCQHTLEHLEDPRKTLEKLLQVATQETVFVFEFPSLDLLLAQRRFDRIFHQHTQYFSLESAIRLIRNSGCEIIQHTFNHLYWGSLIISFKKCSVGNLHFDLLSNKDIAPNKINVGYGVYKSEMKIASDFISSTEKHNLYGYGAALMLPILGYHLENNFSSFNSIFDDDENKDGLGYANLPVKIAHPREFDFTEATIFLTALDNRRSIIRKLYNLSPRLIFNPLSMI